MAVLSSRAGTQVLRAGVALAVLAGAIALVGPRRLAAQLRAADPLWLGLAVASAMAANVLSAWRWAGLARRLGLRAPLAPLVSAYAQGITVNVLLPGATLGGDALRSVRLARMGNALVPSGLSVLLDRVSGLWVVCAMSLLAAAGALVAAKLLGAAAATETLKGIALVAGAWPLVLCAIGVVLVVVLPLLPWRAARQPRAGSAGSGLVVRLAAFHDMVWSRRAAVARSLPASLGVQLLSAATLWMCARATGIDTGYVAILVIAAPIFVAAALPISLGGFGPREFAAALVFPLISVPGPAGVAAALLYGMTAVVQGILAAPLLVLASERDRRSNDGPQPGSMSGPG